MAFHPSETVARMDAALDDSQEISSSTEPSANTLSESLTSKPQTRMDTPLVADEPGQQGAAEEPMKGRDGIEIPGKFPNDSQLLESRLHNLQDRLESLERLEGLRMQGCPDGDNVPITQPTHGDDDDGFYKRRRYHPPGYRDKAFDYETEPAGIYMAKAIRSHEKELGRLKAERNRISNLQLEKDQLQSTVFQLSQERDALRQELQSFNRLEAATAAATTIEAATTSLESTTTAEPTGGKGPTSQQLIPELNLVDWRYFKCVRNRAIDEDAFAIDVLKGEPVISFEPTTYMGWGDHNLRQPIASKASTRKPAATSNILFPGQAPIAERIRINSEHILKILGKIRGDEWPGVAPMVMIRPYKILAYHDQHIRQKLQYLKGRFGREDIDAVDTPLAETSEMPSSNHVLGSKIQDLHESEGVDVGAKDNKPEDSDVNAYDDQDEYTSSPTALKHLKCLVDFMDGDIHQKLQYLESDYCQTITFPDIWYLFRPGLEVIEQTRRQVYRILSISSAPHVIFGPHSRWSRDLKIDEETPVYLHFVYIDFDGNSLGPVLHKFKIPKFEGEKAVTALEVFPLRFAEEKSSDNQGERDNSKMLTLRQRLITRGKKLLDVTTPKHMHYTGLTLDKRDEIDSHVVIDFEEAFLQAPRQDYGSTNTSSEGKTPSWMPTLSKLIGDPPEISFNGNTCESPCCDGERVYKGQKEEQKRNEQHMATLMPNDHQGEPTLMIYPRPLEDIKDRDNSLSDDDFLIMTYRVFGFVLRSRKWAKLDLNYLSLPETSSRKKRSLSRSEHKGAKNDASARITRQMRNASTKMVTNLEDGHEVAPTVEEESHTVFGQLVLPKGHKEMVKSLIAQHFREKESVSKEDRDSQQVDIVRGKEGVAEMFKKPLFQITCGDLGTSASEVEKALEMHFSLANKWGCILLLDEADVFLAARSKSDFIRNGLVSVFLRVLEYYAGILFLTTNRVGDFDEAFASRIHISLYYPHLDIESTEAIFKLNLSLIDDRFRLKQRSIRIEEDEILEFARSYFKDHPKEQWNGRQIRNACQTALALAEYRAQGSSHERALDTTAEVVLRKGDLETVSTAYLEFIKYPNKVRGKDAESWAKSIHLRALEKEIESQKEKAAETVPKTHAQPSETATGPLSQSMAPNQQPTSAAAPPIGASSVAPTGPHFHPPPNYPAVYGYGPQPVYAGPPPEAPHNAPPPVTVIPMVDGTSIINKVRRWVVQGRQRPHVSLASRQSIMVHVTNAAAAAATTSSARSRPAVESSRSGSFRAGSPPPVLVSRLPTSKRSKLSAALHRVSSHHHYQTFPTPAPKSAGRRPSSGSDNADNGSPDSQTASTPLPVKQLALLAVLSLAEQSALNSISPYLPEMVESFPGMRHDQVGLYVGLLASSFALAQLATNLLWGYLSDIVGRKPTMLAGTSLLCVCFLLFGFCTRYYQVVLVHIAMGLLNGNAAVVPSCLGELTDRSNQSKAFTWLPVVYSIGSITGPALGGLLVARLAKDHYPFLAPNIAGAALLAFSVVVLALWFEETLENRDEHPDWAERFPWLRYFSNNKKASEHSWIWPGGRDMDGADDDRSERDEFETREHTGLLQPQSDESGDDDAKSPSHPATWRQLLNRTTVVLLVTSLIFQLSNSSFNSLYPVFASGNEPTGRDLRADVIGVELSVAGIFTIFFQLFLFRQLKGRAGNVGTYRGALFGFAVTMALMPFVGYVDSKPPFGFGNSRIWLYVELGVILVIKNICAVGGLSCVMLLITNSAPSHASLGTLNGIAQTLSAAGRSVGPFISGAIFTASTHVRPKGEALAWGLFAGIALIGWLATYAIRGHGLESTDDGFEDQEDHNHSEVSP
ncbi:hypothetical protein NUW58_g5428 [Xylaria curta]|uniref:Uncharacterized protein n=1 Tax=Xylaria curta TaxID=42375 RepID=A0ACC1P3V8_9PEZI|nr:hypothetical protein NUW58_g5428 [Xylaria curta]